MKAKLAILFFILLPFFAAPVYGLEVNGSCDPNQTEHKCCGGAQTTLISCSNDGDAVTNLLTLAVNFLAVGVGAAVVGGIAYGAFLYASAGASAEQSKRGIEHIRNAVIALVIFILMYAIINFIVPGGLF